MRQQFVKLGSTRGDQIAVVSGVNPGAVQRILRHSDPRITTETYGHLQPDYLRSEIDRLIHEGFTDKLYKGAKP